MINNNKQHWLKSHAPFLSLFPLLLFLAIFVTFGIASCNGGKLTLSPTVAILPAILLSFMWKPRAFNKNLDVFMSGVGHNNILLMCFVFLLSGAFTSVMSSIGGITATVNFALLYSPGLYFTGCFYCFSVYKFSNGNIYGYNSLSNPHSSWHML